MAAGVAMLAAVPAAQAQEGPYVRVDAGFQHRARASENPQTYTDWKNGYAFDVAGGYEAGSHIAVEGEFSTLNTKDKITAAAVTGPQTGVGDVSLRFFMGNVKYSTPGPVRLYVSGGVGGYKSYLHGISNVVAKSFGFEATGSNDGVVFAWQARAGVDFAVAPKVGIIAGYRYLHGGDLLFKNTGFGDLTPNGVKINAVEGGVRVTF
jgi:opacity protein-like surface antigen